MSHPKCHTERGHTCQRPSGRTCCERGCDEPAGTAWGPMWCPAHDYPAYPAEPWRPGSYAEGVVRACTRPHPSRAARDVT